MKYKTLADSLKDVDLSSRTVDVYLSSWDVDSENDQFVPGAWEKTLRERGPQSPKPRIHFLYQHIPVYLLGPWKDLHEDEFGLRGKAYISNTTWGNDVLELYRDGVLREHSVGFDSIKEKYDSDTGLRQITEARLWEGSVVPWGANSNTPVLSVKGVAMPMSQQQIDALAAQVRRVEKALHSSKLSSDELCAMLELQVKQWKDMLSELNADMEIKRVVPYQDLPLAARERPWDATEAERRVRIWAGGPAKEDIDWAKYRKAYVWYDEEAPEKFGSYKLLIADVIEGRLMAVPRGIFAAAAVVQGARGGVDIPESDIPGVKAHLAKYYAKMDLEPPWAKDAALDVDAKPGKSTTWPTSEPPKGTTPDPDDEIQSELAEIIAEFNRKMEV